jgi:MoxR-like ATPase
MAEFTGTSSYVLDPELKRVVNVAMRLELPLLLKGEPGTGKTLLGHAIAEALAMPLLRLNVKSSMKAVEALYVYDTLTRLNDSRFGGVSGQTDSGRNVADIRSYLRMGTIGKAFTSPVKTVLLIDEIDKADSDFQDDLLDVLDQMSFDLLEIDETIRALHRPVVVITSNAKRDLSDPFLGRCVFHHIAFPDPEFMRRIVKAHFPDVPERLLAAANDAFYRLRGVDGVEKKPATRELIHWLRALSTEPEVTPDLLADDRRLPFLGLLFKKSEDLEHARRALRQSAR